MPPDFGLLSIRRVETLGSHMNEIQRVLSQASRRLMIADLLRTLMVVACITLTALTIATAIERIFAFAFPWKLIGWCAAGATVIGAATWTMIVRRRTLAVAQLLDERASLKESLSTAMYLRESSDPWAKVVIESATATAKTVRVGDALPIRTPREWPAPLAAAIVFALVFRYMPLFDVLKTHATKVQEQKKLQVVAEVKADIEKKQEELKKALAKAKVDFLDKNENENKGDQKKPDAKDQDPEALQREAVKKLSELTEKLQAEKEGAKAAQAEAQKEAMRQLRQPGDGPLNEFSRALARGDFNKAQEQLKQITQKMADGSMSAGEKAAAKSQAEAMAKQLSQMAENQSQVAKELQKAGLDKKTAESLAKQAAANPDALKKAVDEMKNLSEAQKEKLLEMAKAAAQAGEKAGKMGEGLSKMAKGMSQDGLQQEGQQGAEELSKELSDSEMLKEDMQNLDAALEQAKAQLAELGSDMGNQGDKPGSGGEKGGKEGSSGWKPGESAGKHGSGSGQAGQSTGGASPEAEASDFEYRKEKANVETRGGPTIGSRLVYGQAVKGEATESLRGAVDAGRQEATEAMDSMQIPREYHDAVKHYFGRLEEKVKKETGAQSPAKAPAPPAATPAAPAKSDKPQPAGPK